MGMSDLISVVVPIYNAEKHLKKCIKSIVEQTYRNIEIILVNDGSTDSSLDICYEFDEDKRILIIDKPNEGLSSARQIGIDKSSGDFLCTVDSDDYIEGTFIQLLYSQIIKENADICVCGVRHYSKDINKINLFELDTDEVVTLKRSDIEKNYYKLTLLYDMCDSWNKMYKMNFIKNTNVKFVLDKKYNGTDLLFNYLLLLHEPKITIVNKPLYNYQIVPNSRVRRRNKQLQEGFIIIMNELIAEVNKLEYSDRINSQLSRLYVVLSRLAASDLYQTVDKNKKLKNLYIDFLEKHSEFVNYHNRVELKLKYMDTLSMKVFSFLLKKNMSKGMIMFYSIRQFLFNVKTKTLQK